MIKSLDRDNCLLSDGIDNALGGGAQALALAPAHLLQESEPLVVSCQLVLLKRALLQRGGAVAQHLNSELMKQKSIKLTF